MENNIISNITEDKSIKKILIIDELSYLNKSKNKFDIQYFYKSIKNENIDVYFISNNMQKGFINIHINSEKINEVSNYFLENDIFFDIIIDINSLNYISQLATFSLLHKRVLSKYLIKTEENKRDIKILLYNVHKFYKNISFENNYLIVTRS